MRRGRKEKELRREKAEGLKEEREKRSSLEQLNEVRERPGESKKETQRLLKKLKGEIDG